MDKGNDNTTMDIEKPQDEHLFNEYAPSTTQTQHNSSYQQILNTSKKVNGGGTPTVTNTTTTASPSTSSSFGSSPTNSFADTINSSIEFQTIAEGTTTKIMNGKSQYNLIYGSDCSEVPPYETNGDHDSTHNSKRKHTNHDRSISPKQTKFINNTTYQYDDSHALLQTVPQQQPPPPPSVATNTSSPMDTLLHPAAFKNTEEMKYFLKHQLQFSDLGKLFGNVDFSTVGHGHLSDYAQYLGLQPTVKFKCFKCSTSTFSSLVELKEHQTDCLKANNNKRSAMAPSQLSSQVNGKPSVLDSGGIAVNGESSLDPANGAAFSEDPLVPAPISTQIDTKIRITRKVYLCSACGTYYENWNLFHHMREVHKKFICLLCLGILPSAERLVHHLEGKHSAKPNVYEHKEELLQAIRDQCYLMCSVCEHIFSEHDDFTSHSCENYIQACSLCGLKFIHKPNCKAGVPAYNKGTRHKNREKQSCTNNNNSNSNNNVSNNKSSSAKRLQRTNSSNMLPTGATVAEENDSSIDKNNCDKYLINGESNNYVTNSMATLKESEPPPIEALHTVVSSPLLPPPVVPNEFRRANDLNSNINHTLNGLMATNESSHGGGKNSSFFKHRDSISAGEDYLDSNNFDMINGYVNESIEKIEKLFNIAPISLEIDEEESIPEKEEPKQQPLLVPKLKLKISKEFQTPIESEESSTESDEEEEEEEEEEDEQEHEEEEHENKLDHTEDNDMEQEPQDNMEVEKLKMSQNNTFSSNSPELQSQPEPLAIIESGEQNSDIVVDDEEEEQYDDQKLSKTSDISNEIAVNNEPQIPIADEDTQLLELLLQQPLDKIPIRELLRICLKASFPICLYCNHARKIAVDGNSLALHLLSQHRFAATVDSITAEELQPATIIQRIKSELQELNIAGTYFNLDSYDSCDKDLTIPYEKSYECFQCRFHSRIHKDLYLHNRKMHLKTVLLCLMCKSNFYSYSELVCHMCPGAPSKLVLFDLKFRCVLCQLDNIPSAFRLMVHLRKKHFACDVCLEVCDDQSKLSSHVWKHKLHHLCYRCGIAYRNKPDITKHLFWKHGTESILCKRCLQKKWPHVYHFCIPPASFVCDQCSMTFRKAVSLKVHKRIHTEDAPYPCTEDNCEKKFISRKLLLKHVARHSAANTLEEATIDDYHTMAEIKTELHQLQKFEDKSELELQHVTEGIVEKNKDHKNVVKRESTIDHDSVEDAKLKVEEPNEKDVTVLSPPQPSKSILDIIDLPAPNLSESDSSDESDSEKPVPGKETLSIVTKILTADKIDEENPPPPLQNIWDNFKSYQATHGKSLDIDEEPEEIPEPPAILHVSQSDHDYCAMYVSIKPLKKDVESAVPPTFIQESLLKPRSPMAPAANKDVTKSSLKSPSKKGRSPKRALSKPPGSDSSSDSSDSDSSCSCGSNCSCTTSSGSGSSSSSSDSDSSSTSTTTPSEKRKQKQEKRARIKSENSAKANLSDNNIDVVTTTDLVPFNIPIEAPTDPDSVIFESDLETDESETDEEFYDEHPQRLASQLLAEKRKQLMLQTCMNPLNSFDIVENSRPSTPSLPEEMVKAKKVKVKKHKRDKKAGKNPVPPLKLSIPQIMKMVPTVQQPIALHILPEVIKVPQQTDLPPPTLLVPPITLNLEQNKFKVAQPQGSHNATPDIAANINKRVRLSTGSSCSDADTPLKRSKRRRIPNKFYGYTSDDESSSTMSTGLDHPFKPTPPPVLTWRKEDLPQTPKSVRTPPVHQPPLKTIIKLPNAINIKPSIRTEKKTLSKKQHLTKTITPVLYSATPPTSPSIQVSHQLSTYQPPIPPIIIRPNRITPQPPPLIEPLRVPAVPVHHIVPPQIQLPDSGQSNSSSSDSSEDEGTLQISQQPVNYRKPKIIKSQKLIAPVSPATIAAPLSDVSVALSSALIPASTTTTTKLSNTPQLPANFPTQFYGMAANQIRLPIMPPAGCRPAKEGEKVYCYCRCPYDEVSEMIACDGSDCAIEWFHFECVNIMVPPEGTWYCPQCRPKYIDEFGHAIPANVT